METQKIGYLGPKGTFTKMAVDSLFDGGEFVSFDTIPACLDAVEAGEIDTGVVPLENAIEGSVHLTIDYLIHQVNQAIIAELTVPIRQHLLTHPEYDEHDITEIHSHSHAIAQCHQYLHKHYPEAAIHYTASTGRAAEIVREKGVHAAAIGNHLAAEMNGLNILEGNIHDYDNNHTRFAVVQKEPKTLKVKDQPVKKHKTTVMVTLPQDYVGALHQVLAAFAWRKMNLSKIESRPMKTGLGNYFFLVDVDQPYDQVLFPGVQQELEALGCRLKVLGTYPSYEIETSSPVMK
ncbi:prephenate dehydratase [Salimicrobium jeotgali]|uniref:Prephenate dehydratase n=2 Tax=Salimicrobium TaxID=351195 RepID=K2H955_9BACI|nr:MULTISPECIES: prephenate dehydratase [Salimicrobium]AKG04218.1 prephenate dehydratase [Salimicrobium jeotgali]EKE32185.1 prephenate dehydratase [Salimicrobium jeotgali]MBM7695796.1 prephenate dehydratase [Salimicrobium jeotgali]PBB06788.1 prephenate dehydratase [Salimicrobium humidisoli]